jgi:tetratricopeptide (TPR) repeat protein
MKFGILVCIFALAFTAQASWYWPFGSDDVDEKKKPPRLSELMEPASLLIDEASDLAADGKTTDAVDKYREALKELDRIERENPERVKAPEFSTVRNKRAYVSAAIDTLLMTEARYNAKAVSVSDTTELEKKLAAERNPQKTPEKNKKTAVVAEKPAEEKVVDVKPKKPLTKSQQVLADIAKRDFNAATLLIKEMLVEKPNDAAALNLRAIKEAAEGDLKAAERTLDQAIQSNPRNHYAYYNMATLMLQISAANKDVARRYYETGRAVGGPVDANIERALK